MRIPKAPFQGATNGLLYALLTGGDCLEYRDILVLSNVAKLLDPPADAQYALFVVEADVTSDDKQRAIRISESIETAPTATSGIPLRDLSVYEVKGRKNMESFSAIGIESEKEHWLRVQFYG
jgi:hypothetical protein